MGGGTGGNDSTDSPNVQAGNDARAEQLSLGEFQDVDDESETLPDFEDFELEDGSEPGEAEETETPIADEETESEAGAETESGAAGAGAVDPESLAGAETEPDPTESEPAEAGPTDSGPADGEATGSDSVSEAGGAGTDPGDGADDGPPDAIPTGGGEGGAFTAAELQEEETAQAFADWVNENTRGPSLTDADVEQIQRLAADDLNADVPDAVDLDDAVEYEPMVFADDSSGASEASMWVARTDDGREMYVTLDSPAAAGNPTESGAIVGAVSRSISGDGDAVTPDYPTVGVDEEREAVVLESVGAEDSTAVSRYRASGEGHTKDGYAGAIAGKLMVGDTDLGGNVVTSSDGDFHPIDFDLAGSDLERKDESIRESDGVLDGEYDGLWDKVNDKANSRTRNFGFEYEQGEIRDQVRSVAESVDVDALERSLSENSNVSERRRDNVIENVRALREGRI